MNETGFVFFFSVFFSVFRRLENHLDFRSINQVRSVFIVYSYTFNLFEFPFTRQFSCLGKNQNKTKQKTNKQKRTKKSLYWYDFLHVHFTDWFIDWNTDIQYLIVHVLIYLLIYSLMLFSQCYFYVIYLFLECGCGGFFLACEDFLRMFDHSFPACAFFFLNGD